MARWNPKTWWILGSLFWALLLGVSGMQVFATRQDVKQWEDYRRAASAKGDDLGVDAWLPPAVPESENFATHPWIASLMASDSTPEAKVARDWQYWRNDEFEDYTGPAEGKSWFEHKPDEAARVMARGATVEAEFKSIHEAAGRPACRLPAAWDRDSERQSDARGRLRDATEMLCLHAEAALATNEETAAVENLLAMLRIGDHLQSQRFLLAVLAGKQTRASALSVIEVGLAGGRFSPESRERLAGALRIPNEGRNIAITMKLERGLILEKMGALLDKKQRGERFLEGYMQPPARRSARFKLTFCQALDPMLENPTREKWEAYDDVVDEVARKSSPGDLAIGSLLLYCGIFPLFFEHADGIDRIRQRLAE